MFLFKYNMKDIFLNLICKFKIFLKAVKIVKQSGLNCVEILYGNTKKKNILVSWTQVFHKCFKVAYYQRHQNNEWYLWLACQDLNFFFENVILSGIDADDSRMNRRAKTQSLSSLMKILITSHRTHAS